MRTLLYRTLILFAMIGFVFTPLILTGYNELRQADSAADAGNFVDAAEGYERAVRFLPWRQDLWQQAGMAYFFSGNFVEAISFLERAKQKNHLSAEGWDWLGQSYWNIGNQEIAQGTWLKGLDTYPAYTRFYAYLSMVYYEQGDLAAEKQALTQWVESGGEVTATSHYRLGILLTLTDQGRALSEFLQASLLDPEFDSAVETMRTTLNLASLESDQSRRLVILGRGLGLVNEWPLAAEAFRQAVAVDGENAQAWAWLGEAEQQLGREGRAELDQAFALESMNPIVLSLRSLYWIREGQPERALTEVQRAAESDSENPAWQYAIGGMYAQLGDLPPALEHYQHATEIAPTDANAWRLLAMFCVQYNMQLEEIGLPAAQMAVELTGEDPLALDTLGWALTRLGHYDEARDALEDAVGLDPHFAQGHLHLAIVAIKLEDWDSAHEHLLRAHDLDSSGVVGEQAQVLLNQYFP